MHGDWRDPSALRRTCSAEAARTSFNLRHSENAAWKRCRPSLHILEDFEAFFFPTEMSPVDSDVGSHKEEGIRGGDEFVGGCTSLTYFLLV